MKLSTIAIAVLAATVSMSAQAEVKLSGDIGVGLFGTTDGDSIIEERGSEINIDVSQEVNGLTYYGHTEIDFQGTNAAADFEEVRVGVKGGFGEIVIGETDNACDKLDVGGYPDKFFEGNQGSCTMPDINNIMYISTLGSFKVAISHNFGFFEDETEIDDVSGEEVNTGNTVENGDSHTALGIQGKFGAVSASFGYETSDDADNITLGLKGGFGPIVIGLRANQIDDDNDLDADVGINAAYTSGANKFYGGFGSEEGEDGWSVGYNRDLGAKTTFVIEVDEQSEDQENVEYVVGLIHKF